MSSPDELVKLSLWSSSSQSHYFSTSLAALLYHLGPTPTDSVIYIYINFPATVKNNFLLFRLTAILMMKAMNKEIKDVENVNKKTLIILIFTFINFIFAYGIIMNV